MNEPVIRFENVSKYYPLYHHFAGGIKHLLFNLHRTAKQIKNSRFEALDNISFDVYRGETLGIIGNNGSGKSTTLGLMAGVLYPSKGKVSVQGRISPLLELGGGFHPDLTGRENIILNGVLMGLTRAEIMAKMDEIVVFSELGEFVDQPIRIYSTGMLARLGFSVVANIDPEIMLIDEILAVGDMSFQEKCLNRMMAFKKSGVTMVLVSHAMEDIERLCDRVAWIEDHRIKKLGNAREVVESYLQTQ